MRDLTMAGGDATTGLGTTRAASLPIPGERRTSTIGGELDAQFRGEDASRVLAPREDTSDRRDSQGYRAGAWDPRDADRPSQGYADRPSGVYGSGWPEVGGLGLDGHVRGLHSGKGPKGYTRNYERVREAVNETLARSPHVDASDIEVGVDRGDITLTGTVEDRAQKRMAEQLTEQVHGVEYVHNQLRITKPSGGQGSY